MPQSIRRVISNTFSLEYSYQVLQQAAFWELVRCRRHPSIHETSFLELGSFKLLTIEEFGGYTVDSLVDQKFKCIPIDCK